MSKIDCIAESVSKMTPAPWEAREPALAPNFGKAKIWPLKITGKLYGHPMLSQDDAEGIALLRNVAPFLVDVARAAESHDCNMGCKICAALSALEAAGG